MEKYLFRNLKQNKKNISNLIRNNFYSKTTHKFFTSVETSKEKSYQPLINYQPDSEVLKFYKNYTNDDLTLTKSYYEEQYKLKKENIQNYNSQINQNKGIFGSISTNINKSLGFLELKSELQEVIKIITSKITVSQENDLQEVSEYYFKQGGKMIRPYLLISFAKYLYECEFGEKNDYFNSTIHRKFVLPYCACVEVLHNASLLHDDIIDNSDKRRSLNTAHNVFGIRKTVYVPHYIISKAANLLTELEIDHLNEIYSSMIYFLTYGECQQSLNTFDLTNADNAFQVYMLKTYYKTASLLALGLRGLGIIFKFDQAMQKKLFNIGLHIGVVFQLVDDVIDVIYDSSNTKKPSLKDIAEGVINSYILFEIQDERKEGKSTEILEMAKRKFKKEGDIQKIITILENGKGIIKTQNLALDHLIECYKILDNKFFINNASKFSLYQSFNFLINRNY